MVPRFNLGRSGLSLLLEGQIDQRKHNHRPNDHDGGVQQDKERSDDQATNHFLPVNLPETAHWVAKRRPPSSAPTPMLRAGTLDTPSRVPEGISAPSGPHLLRRGNYR